MKVFMCDLCRQVRGASNGTFSVGVGHREYKEVCDLCHHKVEAFINSLMPRVPPIASQDLLRHATAETDEPPKER